MGFIQGGDLRIKVDGRLVFHATNAALSFSRSKKKISTKDTNGKQGVLEDYEWSSTGSAVVSNKADTNEVTHVDDDIMIGFALSGAEVDFEFTTGVAGNVVLSGKVNVLQFDINAEVDSESTINYTFDGEGALMKGIVA